jgi:amidohydrolase
MAQAGGNNINIIPDFAEFGIDVRAQQNEVMDDLIKRIDHAVKTAGTINGATVDLETVAAMIAAESSLDMEEV